MKTQWMTLFVLLIVACTGQVASDLYTPAFVAISENLNTSLDQVQLSLSIYLFTMAGSQIIFGPISEALGRKPIMIFGFVVFLFGTAMAIMAHSGETLIHARLVQGLGAGACSGLFRAVIKDLYSGPTLSKNVGILAMMTKFVLPVSPLIGGFLVGHFSWHSNFVFIFAYGVFALLLLIFKLPEPHKNPSISHLNPLTILKNYGFLLFKSRFGLACMIGFINYGALFAWLTISPVLMIKDVGLTPVQFGLFGSLLGGASMLIGAVFNHHSVGKLSSYRLLMMSFILQIIASLGVLTCYFIFGLSFWAIVIPMISYFLSMALIWPNLFTLAFEYSDGRTGHASGLYSTIQALGGAVIGGASIYLDDTLPVDVAFLILGSALLCMLISHKIFARH